MNTYESLFQKICETNDSSYKLILADWLEERGREDEAEAWRWLKNKVPCDLRSHYIHPAWVWFDKRRSGRNRSGYQEFAEERFIVVNHSFVGSKIINSINQHKGSVATTHSSKELAYEMAVEHCIKANQAVVSV